MMASEGVIASIFYCMYQDKLLKGTWVDDGFYLQFGIEKDQIHLLGEGLKENINLYLKIIYALSKIDLSRSTIMTDFIHSYGKHFSAEKEALYTIFLQVTHFATVCRDLPKAFGKLYGIGRSGAIAGFRSILKRTTERKKELLALVLKGDLALDHSLYPENWVEGSKTITPVPWMPEERVKLRIDTNTATEIDFMALPGVGYEEARGLVKARDYGEKGGTK